MRLTRIAARDFMAYESFDLDLSDVSQVVVTGENMAGKSALLDALRWCLHGEVGREISSKDLIIRDGADSAYARVEFSVRDGQSEVVVEREKQRGRTAAVTLTVDGENRTQHTIAETEAVVTALIGLDADALLAGPFMAQETAASFMRARPADRKDLLARLFGLDRYERYWREASDRLKQARSEAAAAAKVIEDADARIEGEATAKASLEYERGKLAAFTEAQSLADARRVAARELLAEARTRSERHAPLTLQRDNLSARIAASDREQAALRNRLEAARSIVSAPKVAVNPNAMREAEDALEAARDAERAQERLVAELREAAEAVKAGDARIATIVSARGKVATVPCHAEGEFASCRFLTDVPSSDQQAEAEAALLAAIDARAAVDARVAAFEMPRMEPLRERVTTLRALTDEVQRAENIRAAATATIEEGDRALKALRDTQVTDGSELDRVREELKGIDAAREAVGRHQSDLSDAESTYAQARASADRHAANVRVNEQQLAAIEAAKAIRAEWLTKRADLDTLAHSLALIAEAFHRDGIPTTILARGIPLIEAEANRVLDSLPGGLSIALRTQRAKATGGMAETLDVVVTVGGWEREYGLLSVGGRFRVDLSLRLALARVLTHRTGGSIETLWLDEPLAALDTASRQAVMETLAAIADDFGLIVIVSHHPDFNDAFGARIDVAQVDGISTAVLAA